MSIGIKKYIELGELEERINPGRRNGVSINKQKEMIYYEILKVVDFIERLFPIKLKPSKRNQIEKNLKNAGVPSIITSERFIQIKRLVLLVITFCTAILGWMIFDSFFPTIIGIMFGFGLPGTYLGVQIKKRNKEILVSIVPALDMIKVCIAAGMPLEQSIADGSKGGEGLMFKELEIVSKEVVQGTPLKEAVCEFADRFSSVQEINQFYHTIATIVSRGGSPVGPIEALAMSIKQQIEQKMKAQASRASIQVFIPILIFILPPAAFFMLGGPVLAMINSL